ncbi:MAG TPA: nucleoside-diphosphate sugar epimerase/dehydratase [Daejeonella sp.]|nr:nucleoside-diphosphate sugar epimerase/dehydratase [Daejeonella sp.]
MKSIIYGEKALSKWVIFLIDQVIVSWSLAVSFFVNMEFEFSEMLRGPFFIYSGLYSLIAMIVFIRMRIHTGIIRYSNTADIIRIFSAVLLTTLLYIGLVKLFVIPNHLVWNRFPYVVSVNFFISSSVLIMLRIGVKSFFSFLKSSQRGDKEIVLIYGSDSSAILLKQALEINAESRFEIIGFIDDDPDKVDKYIEQKKVFHSSALVNLKKKHRIKNLLVMGSLPVDGRRVAIEKCLELGIKIQKVPPADQWLYGRLQLNQIRSLKIEDLLQREPIILKKNNILTEIAGKRILVTGAGGSIGSEIVRQLLDYNPEEVILCDQAESPLHELKLEVEDNYAGAKIVSYMANIQNKHRLYRLFKKYKPQIVFHAAAYKHVPMMESHPFEAVMTNVLGTKNLADISVEFGVDKFIMISTDKAVNPTNVMGASKRIAEIYIQSLNGYKNPKIPDQQCSTKFITTRFGNVLGSSGSVLSRFQGQIERGGPITVTHPEITRYFMTIPEAVQLVMEAAAMGYGGEVFVFDMGNPIKIVELARNMIKLSGLSPDKDVEIVFCGLRPGEKLYEELLCKDEHSIPTHHHKIKISRVITYPFEYVEPIINELLELSNTAEDEDMVKKMKEIVPEYISNNSVYEKLDILKAVS